jgi:hypothetical protein
MSATARVTRSPYLLTNGAGHLGVPVSVNADASSTVAEMTVHGRWSPTLGALVAADLQLCLAGPAMSIIVDLHDLDDVHGVSRRFWLAAGRAAQDRSTPARISLCLPTEAMLAFRLRRLEGHQRFLFAAMPEARAAVADRHALLHQAQARLAPRPASVPMARELVAQACEDWKLPEVCDDASLIISELAGNAVQHAGTEIVVTASKDDTAVHLAVRDGASEYPRLSEPGRPRTDERGRGLILVHAIAAAWGAIPAHGGKVVWATVGASINVEQR